MKALLICPADRPQVAFLARSRPLALAPILGRTLLDLWLMELASRGAKSVIVLASDRPEEIRRHIHRGEAWGLRVEVQPEQRESTPDEARARYLPDAAWLPAPADVTRLDHLPGGPPDLWADVARWLVRVRAETGTALRSRVGMRELSPGIALHVRSRVAPSAVLHPPCWIGANACIGEHVVVGPNAIIEEAAFLDDGAEVVESFVGPSTYVGALTEVRDSMAWGQGLYRWTNGSFTEVVDDFLLADLAQRARRNRAASFPGRVAALLVLLATAPVLLAAWLRRRPGTPMVARFQALRAPVADPAFAESFVRRELTAFTGLWRRWPELWNIVRGDSGWVGNRPLAPEQAAMLVTEFERLWLAVPPGLFALADAEATTRGGADPFDDEARGHASFYAVHRSWKTDLGILRRVLARRLSD